MWRIPSVILHILYHKSAILECHLSLRQYFYAYDPFCSVYVQAEVCNQNAIFSLFYRNTGHRSTQFGDEIGWEKPTPHPPSPPHFIMSYNPLTTWSHEVTWSIKSKRSPIMQGLWPHILIRIREFIYVVARPSDHVVTWGHVAT